ncbi:MAG TPA: peptidylprolyl isomerase [Dermatophilaceae bacterium]
MSPHARNRARDRRRDKKRQSARARREMESRRNKQVLVIVLALVVLIGGFVALSMALKKGDATPAAAQAQASAQPTSSSPAANLVAGCVAPPGIPNDTRARTLPEKKIAAGKTFIATIMTNCGVVKVELDGAKAPQAVASFLALAESGYWADSPCHRLTTAGIFVLQCGDPTGTGKGTPGYGFGVENAPASSVYPAGTLAMARATDPKSNGGQFFVVYKQTQLKDPTGKDTAGYSIFGKVTSGMDIVDKIAAAGASQPDANQNTAPLQPVSILAVNVTEKKA